MLIGAAETIVRTNSSRGNSCKHNTLTFHLARRGAAITIRKRRNTPEMLELATTTVNTDIHNKRECCQPADSTLGSPHPHLWEAESPLGAIQGLLEGIRVCCNILSFCMVCNMLRMILT